VTPRLLVVGVGPGIGTAVARRFAREHYTVGLVARSAATVERAADALGADATTWTRTADATDEVALRAALDAFVAEHGVPDVVVYNAAIIRRDEPGALSVEEHLAAWSVNVVGAITTAGVLLPRMASGTFVVTSGMPVPDPQLTSLSLGKAGVRALVDLLAAWQDRVHVASVTVGGPVAPGTAYDPDEIAEHYWDLHAEAPAQWRREVRHG
jgi:NAD(P)-dependent dehydrogenase (short-subunit alcohol dehydrogenase family)